MVYKVMRSAESSRYPFFYNINKIEQGEAELVAVRNVEGGGFGSIYRTLLERDAMALRTEKVSVHFMLSGDEGETLTDEQAVELIDKNMSDVGMDKQPYIIVRHDDTDHVHYHIVSTKVKDDGRSIIWNGIGKRLVHSLSKYQNQYGYLASRKLRKKKREAMKRSGVTAQLNDIFQSLLSDQSVITREIATQKMLTSGIEMKWFMGKHTGKEAIRLRRLDDRNKASGRPVYISSDNTEKLENSIRKNISQQPLFIIHNNLSATLYCNTPTDGASNHHRLAYDAARLVLKFYTWGADMVVNQEEEFMRLTCKGQQYGLVLIDIGKARFLAENNSGIIENPDEVVSFIDCSGEKLDFFTDDFWQEWNRLLEATRQRLISGTEINSITLNEDDISLSTNNQSIEKTPVNCAINFDDSVEEIEEIGGKRETNPNKQDKEMTKKSSRKKKKGGQKLL